MRFPRHRPYHKNERLSTEVAFPTSFSATVDGRAGAGMLAFVDWNSTSAEPTNEGERFDRPRVAFLTLGCRVNQYDTDAMRSLLAPSCEAVEEQADVYILNGCSVTGLAEKKARQAVHRLRAEAPASVIVVVGCLGEALSRGMTTIEGEIGRAHV
jgi:hypothetical protein